MTEALAMFIDDTTAATTIPACLVMMENGEIREVMRFDVPKTTPEELAKSFRMDMPNLPIIFMSQLQECEVLAT